MRVRWFHSLSFKLFLLLAGSLLATTLMISWKNIRDFQEIMQSQIAAKTLDSSRTSLNAVTNQVNLWNSLNQTTLKKAAYLDAKALKLDTTALVESSQNILFFQILKVGKNSKTSVLADAFTSSVNDERFGAVQPNDVLKKLRSFQRKRAPKFIRDAPAGRAQLLNISPIVSLPLLQITIVAKTPSGESILGIMTTWQTPLLAAMVFDNETQSFLIDKGGRTLVSQKENWTLRRQSQRTREIVKRALSGNSNSGTVEYLDKKSKESRVAAFAWSDDLKIGAIYVRNPLSARKQIQKEITTIGIIVFLVVLGAIYVSFLAARSITSPLRRVTNATFQIASGDFESEISNENNDEVGVLSQAVNHMSSRIRYLLSSQVEAARQEKELETAKTVQETLFPKRDVQSGPLMVTGHYQPASECGGDWWGHFQTKDDMEFLCIADATGHGAAAALVTALAFSSCMTQAEIFQEHLLHDESPAKFLEKLNRIMWMAGHGSVTMTFFASFINPQTGTMTFANAGHNFPILIPEEESDSRLSTKGKRRKSKFQTIQGSGSPLGIDPKATYTNKTIQLKPGDKLFLYTDGLIECTNEQGQMWGKRKMTKSLEDLKESPISEIKTNILQGAFRHFNGHPCDDDVTVVVAELDKNWQPKMSSKVA